MSWYNGKAGGLLRDFGEDLPEFKFVCRTRIKIYFADFETKQRVTESLKKSSGRVSGIKNCGLVFNTVSILLDVRIACLADRCVF